MRNQSCLLHLLLRTHHKIPNQSHVLRSFSSIPLRFTTNQSKFPINPNFCNFSSKPILANVDSDHSVIVDIFSKSRNFDEVKNQLDLNQLSISHYEVNRVLRKLDSDPDSVRIFFQWGLENYPEKLSSESYNQFLADLAINGAVEEFWDLVGVMKKKGFGVSKWVIDRTLEYSENNGMDVDALKLKELFDNDTIERLCRIVRNNVWSDDVEKEI
ncbi:pentatricopeptide repeat-containing protein, partial [Trifolium medium]|nr:pentatricopeptide repeat-containing protein [Trifolium medium]